MTVNLRAYTAALPSARTIAAACDELLNSELEVPLNARPTTGPNAELLEAADQHARAATEIKRLEDMPVFHEDEVFEDLDEACFAALDLATETPAATAAGLRAKLRILVNHDHLTRVWPRRVAAALAYDILTITVGGRA